MPLARATTGRDPFSRTVIAALLLVAASASAQPAHCERALGSHAWPETGAAIGIADPTPVTEAEARRAVLAFRREWRSIPHPGAVLRSFTECLSASLEHFVVRRVALGDARRGVERLAGEFPGSVLGGTRAWEGEWVWEVYWGGASRRHPPSGPLSMYLAPDLGTVIAAVQWPEG